MTGKAFVLAAAALVVAGAAHADVHIRLQDTQRDSAPVTVDMYVHDGQVRIDQSDNRTGYTLFDSRTGTMTMVMTGRRRYVRFNRESADRAREQMQQQMQAQLANAPPAQRDMLRQMMEQRNRSASAPTAPPKVSDTGRNATVSGIRCRLYRVLPQGGTPREICMASRATLRISRKDLHAIRTMASEGREIARHLGGDSSRNFTFDPAQMPGFPVMERPAADDAATGTSRLQAIDHERLDPAMFRVPAGYTQRPLMEQ
ncbi:MAG TPA: hypothetical protein VFA95_08485 [Gammaproteobacteria bacterium]|nr:hypothetical protein [Gammaproteobacteria bacterium]